MQHSVYITREQIQRLAAMSCDALSGIQVTTDDSPTILTAVTVDFDQQSVAWEIYEDGSYINRT